MENTKKHKAFVRSCLLSDSYRIQTCNLLIRSQMLYSVELRSRIIGAGPMCGLCFCFLLGNVHLTLLDAGLLAGKVAEVEDTCPADFTDLVDLDGVDER